MVLLGMMVGVRIVALMMIVTTMTNAVPMV